MRFVETGDDAVGRAVAMWLALESCRPYVDTDGAEDLTAAMASIGEAVRLAHALPVSKRGAWLADVVALENMVEEVHALLRSVGARETGR